MGVAYEPEIAKGLSPNPTGDGVPKNTACVTFIPMLKPKNIPCQIPSVFRNGTYRINEEPGKRPQLINEAAKEDLMARILFGTKTTDI